MLTYIQWGTKDFEFELNSAYNSGQEIKLYELNYALDSVNKAISSWIETHHGKEILNACTMGVFEVEAEHLVDLDQLCEFISSCSQMEFCFGVGVEAPHAKSACEYGLYHGDKISLYHDDMDLPEEEEDPLVKSESDMRVFWHGSPSGELKGSPYGLHVGSRAAAEDALHARIGYPATGSWDGTREYGSTLLAGQKTLKARGIFPSGYSAGSSGAPLPEEDHLPNPAAMPQFSDGNYILPNHKPVLFQVAIKGPMANHPSRPHADYAANGRMKGLLATGRAKSGYYYKNEAEDAGSISAVVPGKEHLTVVDSHLAKAEHPDAHGQLAQQQEDPTEVIMAGIKLLKEHSAKIEELKQASPEIYDTIRHISQAMVAMAKQMSEIKQAANQESESIKKSEQLFKTDMSQEDGNKLGSHQGYANLAEQFNYLDHTNAKPIGNGFFHHTFEGAQGQIHSHTLSRSADPRKPHIAQLHMALQDDGIPSVESIAVHPDYKGHGYGKALYLGAIQHHGKIYSDTKMSPNAGKAWQHLATVANVTDGPDGRKMASLEKKLSFPEPLAGVGTGANGAVHKKKIKTAVRDQATGKKKPARWRSVRSGMVMSQSGGVASSRLPNVE